MTSPAVRILNPTMRRSSCAILFVSLVGSSIVHSIGKLQATGSAATIALQVALVLKACRANPFQVSWHREASQCACDFTCESLGGLVVVGCCRCCRFVVAVVAVAVGCQFLADL